MNSGFLGLIARTMTRIMATERRARKENNRRRQQQQPLSDAEEEDLLPEIMVVSGEVVVKKCFKDPHTLSFLHFFRS